MLTGSTSSRRGRALAQPGRRARAGARPGAGAARASLRRLWRRGDGPPGPLAGVLHGVPHHLHRADRLSPDQARNRSPTLFPTLFPTLLPPHQARGTWLHPFLRPRPCCHPQSRAHAAARR